jgi:putative ABC transport system permease protein
MNTLSMAAMERVSEIGMMRAVGAKKRFVSTMFLAETAMLSGVFGGAGIGLGIGAVWGLSALQIASKNEMMQLFYGGDTFHPMLSAWDILICVGALIGVTILSVIYPVIVARRITPLDAITRE